MVELIEHIVAEEAERCFNSLEAQHAVRRLCRALSASVSGYYRWRADAQSQ